MIRPEILLYVLIMAGVTYLVRLIPILLVKKQIKNQFLLSFLHYVPYAVLSSMTVPACFMATGHIVTGVIGFVARICKAQSYNCCGGSKCRSAYSRACYDVYNIK